MPRATPLPPEERRAALIAVTLPLLVAHGREVSTRQIAEAAGVAEGTIFRVFDTKEELIDASLDEAFDPSPVCAELAAIHPELFLEDRLAATVGILQGRIRTIFSLFHTLRLGPPKPADHDRRRHDDTRLNAAVAEVLAPDADRLTMSADQAAQLLRAVTFAVSHPMASDLPHDDPTIIVDLLLHGLLGPADRPDPLDPPTEDAAITPAELTEPLHRSRT